MLVKEGGQIVHVEEMGLRQLAYTISKRSSGIYYCIEFAIPEGSMIPRLELALRRDERIMRFLTVRLDKYGVKYNDDKRQGLIGKIVKAKDKDDKKKSDNVRPQRGKKPAPAPKPTETPAPKTEAATAPVATPSSNEEE